MMVTMRTTNFAVPAQIISQGFVWQMPMEFTIVKHDQDNFGARMSIWRLLSSKVPCSLLKKAPVTFWLMVFMTSICKWHKRLSSASPPSVMSLQP